MTEQLSPVLQRSVILAPYLGDVILASLGSISRSILYFALSLFSKIVEENGYL
jgi:hypothetical protein